MPAHTPFQAVALTRINNELCNQILPFFKKSVFCNFAHACLFSKQKGVLAVSDQKAFK
jgi:hypothetical protein